MSEIGINLELGRDNQAKKRDNIEGRIYLDSNSLDRKSLSGIN
jgi:hypothetical protein